MISRICEHDRVGKSALDDAPFVFVCAAAAAAAGGARIK